MTAWCRLHQDMPNDPKWRVVARRSGRPISEVLAVFVHMMVNVTERHANAAERAANAAERGELVGWDDEDIAIALDIDSEHVAAIREAMQGKTLDGNRLSGWERRQPLREDGSAERAKAWREEQKAKKDAERAERTHTERVTTDSRTHANAAERKQTPEADIEAEADIDTEARQASSVAHPAPEPRPAEPAFDLRSFESLCLDTLAGSDPPKGSFAPMAALLGPDVDPDRIVTLIRAELAKGRKAVGSWKLWAQICAERLTEGPMVPSSGKPACADVPASVFVEVDTPEWRAWMARREAEGKRGCPVAEDSANRSRRGWRFPSLWPPGAEPKASPASAPEPGRSESVTPERPLKPKVPP